MKKVISRVFSFVLMFALVFQVLSYSGVGVVTVQAAGEQYGLPSKTEDGIIFHAWNWSFDTIKEKLPELAAAGYKSVQTSPIQGTKENTMTGSYWWVLYQPINFTIGNAQLGTREQFRQLCEEAEKYGISIIVDVVANHTGNAGGGTLQYTPAYNVDPSIRNNPNFWHEAKGVQNWNDRWQVTQWGIGLPDLNTSNQELQDKIIAFLNDAIALGADGFRFDAAKHIELPTDTYASSNFWTRVLGSLNNKENIYIYGEVLQGGADAFAQYANYMDVTASYYGDNVRHAVGFNSSKNVNTAKDYNASGVDASKLVTWVESHDTYANDGNESTYMTEWQLKMGWAIVASRAQTISLFFNRPAGSGKFAASLGTAGNNHWKDPDIVAVNKFSNAMAGQGEYLRNQGNEILLVERGTKGMTIVNLGSDAYINSATNLANGTYTNKASGGGTFTVSNGIITGHIGGGNIAVLYNETANTTPTIIIDKPQGSFYTDSLAVKMSYTNATTATYSINNGTPVSFQSGDTITLGAGAAFDSTYAVTITASGLSGTFAQTFTFKKEDPNAALIVHFYKPSNWGAPNIYYYNDSVTPIVTGAAWPGVAMNDEGNGWYSYSITGMQAAKVIFNSNGNQLPAAQQPGYTVTQQSWIKNGVVSLTNPDIVAPTISIDKSEGSFTSESLDITMSYQHATAASYSLNGGAAVPFTSEMKLTLGAGDAAGTTYNLTITATGEGGITNKTYQFTKQQPPQTQSIAVHFYKPSSWGTPNIYYYNDATTPIQTGGAWPGTAMVSEGNGWYSYTITGMSSPKVIFNSNGQQAPTSQQPGYTLTQDSWIKDGVVTTSAPEEQATTVTVTFQVNNATTTSGQQIYLVGNHELLGNWDPAKAVGPGTATNYPNWTFSVALPVGTTIQYKAIKKNGNAVVWESGANRTYTVSSSQSNVSFSFNP